MDERDEQVVWLEALVAEQRSTIQLREEEIHLLKETRALLVTKNNLLQDTNEIMKGSIENLESIVADQRTSIELLKQVGLKNEELVKIQRQTIDMQQELLATLQPTRTIQ